MYKLFWEMGGNKNETLDLTSWNVGKIIYFGDVNNFSAGTGINIIEPKLGPLKSYYD